MARIVKEIRGIFNGRSPTWYFEKDGYFLDSIAIDPEANLNSSLLRPGNNLPAIRYQKFSGSNVNTLTNWLETNPKDQNIYAYLDNGKFISYNTVFAETLIGTPTSGAGNGMKYYNNYIYLMTPTQVFRYGPLNNSPTLSNALIANGELLDGWNAGSDTLLTNTAYPGIRSMTYPNHAAHVHVDNKLYVCDFINGQGMVHFIKTLKTTDEGDTNDGSTYNALDLPFGYYPFDIESWGTDLAILAAPVYASAGSGITYIHGQAMLFLWDTISSSFYRSVPIPTAYATAMVNHNGVLKIWGGQIDFGYSLFQYRGGDQVDQLDMFLEGSPPPAGGVDIYCDRVVWGAYGTYPTSWAGLMSQGYQHPQLPQGAINCIARITNTSGTLPVVGAVRFTQQGQYIKRPIMGWRVDTTAAYGIDRTGGSESFNSLFNSCVFTIGQPFSVKEVQIDLGTQMQTGINVTPSLYFDSESTNSDSQNLSLPVLNPTNYPNSERHIRIKPPGLHAKHDFYLRLVDTGTTACPILFPIRIIVETLND